LAQAISAGFGKIESVAFGDEQAPDGHALPKYFVSWN
jgi:hypothetical protein